VLTLAAALWSALVGALVAFLHLTRGFVLYPLFLALIGGLGVAAAFGLQGQWNDAASALLVAAIAGVSLALWGAFALRLDPRFFDKPKRPPRWER
jgi:uncharacterized membrane-anchored protein